MKTRSSKSKDRTELRSSTTTATAIAKSTTTTTTADTQNFYKMQNTPAFQPTPFSGTEDPVQWLAKFEAFVDFQEWQNEPHRVINSLKLLLTSTAFAWAEKLSIQTHPTVKDIFDDFKTEFLDKEPTWLLEQALWSRSQKEDESVDSFAGDIRTRCARLKKSSTEMLQAFVRGLHPSLRGPVIQANPDTLSKAITTAKLAQEAAKISAPPAEKSSDLAQKVEAILQTLQNPSLKTPGVHVAESSSVKCQLCGYNGHTAPDCRRRRPRPQVPTSALPPVTCYFCGRKGHIQRDCRDRRHYYKGNKGSRKASQPYQRKAPANRSPQANVLNAEAEPYIPENAKPLVM